MSISKVYVTMKCDECSKKKELNVKDIYHIEDQRIRDEIALQNWTYVNGQDLCPSCSE